MEHFFTTGNYNMDILVWIFILTALMVLGISILCLRVIKILEREINNPVPLHILREQEQLRINLKREIKKAKPPLLNRLAGLRPLSDEKDMMMEHEFDGIAELNNPTPGWFMVLFYSTIIFAVGYLLNYHVFNYGKLQDEEYAVEMKQADEAKKLFLATSTDAVDENNVLVKADGPTISSGSAIYKQNCVPCHGDRAQGVVGPNLTDEYWLHGGKIASVFKTIKYGIPEKGMISWEKMLTPKQISEVANYVLSLHGSSPENPKEPQGEKEL